MKWFNAVQGYGFIVSDDGEELFVHHSKILAEGFRKLTAGERVSFEVEKGPKGPFAIEVRRSDDADSLGMEAAASVRTKSGETPRPSASLASSPLASSSGCG